MTLKITSQAHNYLDTLWEKMGRQKSCLPMGSLLWHCGVFGPKYPLSDDRMIWTTVNPDKKRYYENWAKDNAKKLGLDPFLHELSPRANLKLADYKNADLTEFTKIYCDANHNIMKNFVAQWAVGQEVDGISGVNGPDQIAILRPATNLSYTSIPL